MVSKSAIEQGKYFFVHYSTSVRVAIKVELLQVFVHVTKRGA
jgi:hypothetical protein